MVFVGKTTCNKFCFMVLYKCAKARGFNMKRIDINDVVAIILCEIELSENYEFDTDCLEWNYIKKIVTDYLINEMCLRSKLWYMASESKFFTSSLRVNFLVEEINTFKEYLLNVSVNYEEKDNQIIFTEIKVMPIEWYK